jgi:hypothetical protein
MIDYRLYPIVRNMSFETNLKTKKESGFLDFFLIRNEESEDFSIKEEA